jgi:NAD(P)-dependent dehydrogenase (short-subunit alcohol dehydrogenase family)
MKTAVVTGGGGGLGRAIAAQLAQRGFGVLVTDVDEAAAKATAADLGGGAWAMRQDVRDPDSHRQVAAAAAERGPLSVWVNNAGVLATGAVWELDEAEVRRHLDVNLLGVIWGSRAAVERIDTSGGAGHIINIASLSSLVPAPGLAVYGATKHAVLGLSTGLQGDLVRAGKAIHVSAICPDAIETDMVRKVEHDEASSILFSARKLLRAEDVARAAVAVLDDPKLVVILPRYRAALVHAFHPFPALGLRVLEQFRKVGERHRRKREEA